MQRRPQGILTGMPFMTHVASRSFVDDAGRKIHLSKPPTRIVSLAPSVTEILFTLGAGDQLVGVTEFCDYPPEALQKQRVGYSNPNLESVMVLQPDLVLAPRDFLKPDLIMKFEQLKVPVFVLQATTVEDIFAHLNVVGRMLDRSTAASDVTLMLRRRIAEVRSRVQGLAPVRVLYVLNSQPLITVGPGSYIDQLITMAGGINVAAKSGMPYPRLNLEVVLQQDPEVLVFPVGRTEGTSAAEQEAWRQWITLTAVARGRLHEIPADLLNRPGPRVVEALERLAEILHPEAITSHQSTP
jgi:iron complex transport system substrate-binding protein